jgi:hypothetical protein
MGVAKIYFHAGIPFKRFMLGVLFPLIKRYGLNQARPKTFETPLNRFADRPGGYQCLVAAFLALIQFPFRMKIILRISAFWAHISLRPAYLEQMFPAHLFIPVLLLKF